MARILVHQVDFPRSAPLERHITEKLGPLLRREEADGRTWSIEVFVRIAHRTPEGRAIAYEARVSAKLPGRHRPLAAAGKGRTARLAFGDGLDKLEKRLRRGARMRQSARRTVSVDRSKGRPGSGG